MVTLFTVLQHFVITFGFFDNSTPVIAQFAQLAKLAQLVQMAQFDQLFKVTDRNFAAASIALACSNYTIFRNKTIRRFDK